MNVRSIIYQVFCFLNDECGGWFRNHKKKYRLHNPAPLPLNQCYDKRFEMIDFKKLFWPTFLAIGFYAFHPNEKYFLRKATYWDFLRFYNLVHTVNVPYVLNESDNCSATVWQQSISIKGKANSHDLLIILCSIL